MLTHPPHFAIVRGDPGNKEADLSAIGGNSRKGWAYSSPKQAAVAGVLDAGQQTLGTGLIRPPMPHSRTAILYMCEMTAKRRLTMIWLDPSANSMSL